MLINYIKKKLKQRKLEKNLINQFLKEHEKHIPKYSPKGLKFDWNISVHKNGEYDIFTGEFLGDYEVVITQNPPEFLGIDDTCYRYNTKTKKLEKTLLRWYS